MEKENTQAVTSGNFLAIKPVEAIKVTAKINNGLATVAQRTETIVADLVMDFKHPNAKTYMPAGEVGVILKGSAGMEPWNKQVMEYRKQKFVLCPLDQVIGFELRQGDENEED